MVPALAFVAMEGLSLVVMEVWEVLILMLMCVWEMAMKLLEICNVLVPVFANIRLMELTTPALGRCRPGPSATQLIIHTQRY